MIGYVLARPGAEERRRIDAAIDAAAETARELGSAPSAVLADFLERYAAAIESRADEIVAMDPRPPLFAGPHRPADAHLEGREHRLQRPAARRQDGDGCHA